MKQCLLYSSRAQQSHRRSRSCERSSLNREIYQYLSTMLSRHVILPSDGYAICNYVANVGLQSSP